MYKTQSSHVVLNIQIFRRDTHLKIPELKNTKLMTRQIYDKLNNVCTRLRGGTQKLQELLKNIKIFVKILNFSPLRSTPPATGCSNSRTAPNAGNIICGNKMPTRCNR